MMLVNGAPADSVPATDRGLAYGDGVFRTLAAVQGQLLHWARQYSTLERDCAALGLVCPAEQTLRAEARLVAAGHARAAVKLMVTRGSGPRGYAVPRNCEPTRIVMAEALGRAPRLAGGVGVHLCRLRLAHQPVLAGVKHLNRLENVLARGEWSDGAIAEGLMLDQSGNAIGGTMTNLFIVEQGALLTPDLSQCGVAGVTRTRVMELAKKAGIVVRIEALPFQRVMQSDEAFLVNSLIGLWPIAKLLDRAWFPGLITRQVRRWLEVEDAENP